MAHRLYLGLTNAVARRSSLAAAVRRVRHILDVFGMVLDGDVAQVCSRSSTKRDSFICIVTNLHTSSVLIIVT